MFSYTRNHQEFVPNSREKERGEREREREREKERERERRERERERERRGEEREREREREREKERDSLYLKQKTWGVGGENKYSSPQAPKKCSQYKQNDLVSKTATVSK